jgi:hypothetical protein
MDRSPLRLGFVLTALAGLLALSLQAQTCQEGCLANENTALGDDALLNNTTGDGNTAIGERALLFNTTGGGNTAIGIDALHFSTTGFANTATGDDALLLNSTGNDNTASGTAALYLNTGGDNNTAIGFQALASNTTGSSNIALGVNAGEKIVTGSNNIDIGNVGNVGESGAIRIGTMRTQTKTFIAGINGRTVPTGVPVIVDTTGHLGTTTSSTRFKEAIKPMDMTSEAILSLKPVTFRYKRELDPNAIPQFGLLAEDVEKVNPDLVARDEQGKPYTVRYEAVNAMLLNEFLKEHKAFVEEQREVQEQKATIAELKSALEQQQKDFLATGAHQQEQIEALTAGVQKVSAQLEVKKTGLQTIANNQ